MLAKYDTNGIKGWLKKILFKLTEEMWVLGGFKTVKIYNKLVMKKRVMCQQGWTYSHKKLAMLG